MTSRFRIALMAILLLVVVELVLAGTSKRSAPRALVTTVGAFSTGQMRAPILPVTSPGDAEDDEVAIAVAVDRTAAGDRVHGPQPSGPLWSQNLLSSRELAPCLPRTREIYSAL